MNDFALEKKFRCFPAVGAKNILFRVVINTQLLLALSCLSLVAAIERSDII